MVTSFLYVRECVSSGLVLFSMWLTDGAVPWAREGHFLQKEPCFSIIRYRESMWVAMMTDSELFLQNWLQTVSVFQGSDKTHVDQYTDHQAQGPEGICRAIHHRQL